MERQAEESPPTAPERLRHALREMEARYEAAGQASIGDLLAPLGPHAGALGAALLALPFLSPVSLGPITTVASAAIALLGLRMLRGSDHLPLPDRLLRVSIPRVVHRAMHAALDRVIRWTGDRRRAHALEHRPPAEAKRLCGAGVLAGALLLAVPIPLLPLTNTLPAAAVILFALGWANADRRLTTFGFGALAGSVALFGVFGAGVALLGTEAVRQLIPVL